MINILVSNQKIKNCFINNNRDDFNNHSSNDFATNYHCSWCIGQHSDNTCLLKKKLQQIEYQEYMAHSSNS